MFVKILFIVFFVCLFYYLNVMFVRTPSKTQWFISRGFILVSKLVHFATHHITIIYYYARLYYWKCKFLNSGGVCFIIEFDDIVQVHTSFPHKAIIVIVSTGSCVVEL